MATDGSRLTKTEDKLAAANTTGHDYDYDNKYEYRIYKYDRRKRIML